MLEFVQALTGLVAGGDGSTRWDVSEIARLCDHPCHQVFEYLTVALGDDIDVREPISRNMLLQVLVVLKEKTRPQFILKQKRILAKQEKAHKSYQVIMAKVRASQRDGEWRKAYRSLGYFASDSAQDLPADLRLTIYNDCLRLGIKARTNLQDLCGWLRLVVDIAVQDASEERLRDALDFVETYQGAFLDDTSGVGGKLLDNIVTPLRERASNYDLQLPPLLAS